jgi:hypothetical protein
MDMIGPLPAAPDGSTYILTMIDHFSRLKACSEIYHARMDQEINVNLDVASILSTKERKEEMLGQRLPRFTRPDRFPSPEVCDSLDKLAGCHFFSLLDAEGV